jgi:hypothetical protein
LLLGVPKDADALQIEASWARCVLWARQGKTQVALGDVHWAREVLRDPEQRLAADAASLNTDLASEALRKLTARYHLDGPGPAWTPIDPDPPALKPTDLPDLETARASVPAPDVPLELPGVARWLEEFARIPLDPWAIDLPAE